MEGNCQVNDVVYECEVRPPLPKKVYLGLAEGEWKNCFYNGFQSLVLRILTQQMFQKDHTFKLHMALEMCFN